MFHILHLQLIAVQVYLLYGLPFGFGNTLYALAADVIAAYIKVYLPSPISSSSFQWALAK